MAKIFNMEEASRLAAEGASQLKYWLYNALDATGTREIRDVLLPRLNDNQRGVYRFHMALHNPVMDMMVKGVGVDLPKRKAMADELKRELIKANRQAGKVPQIAEVWDARMLETGKCPAQPDKKHLWPRLPDDDPLKCCKRCGAARWKPEPFNANSHPQCHHLFYELLGIPPLKNKQKKISVDDDVLGRIAVKYPALRPAVTAVQFVRDVKKQLSTVTATLSDENRWPSSFNIAAAWTSRFSSSKDPFKRGGNLQNIAARHRAMFIADPGYDMDYVDKMQAESNVVAHLAGDEEYIQAHESGDVHTYVTRLVWPELPWNGDLKKDKVIAKRLPDWDPVDGHDFRFQAKRIQHGSNFLLSPYGIAQIAHIPFKQAKTAQAAYFDAFPGIPAWQKWVIARIQRHEPLVNPLGFEVMLTGRTDDEHTWKQGCALLPQSTVAFLLNLAMLRVWWAFPPGVVQLLAQVHDAVLSQHLTNHVEVLKTMQGLMEIATPVTDIYGKTRTMKIGVEAATGRNWGKRSDTNPRGMVEI